jgi:phenylalanyl-tRNA synthetase beta chain
MPIVGISTARLRKLLGSDLESEKIAEAIDRLGCDLEEVAEVHIHACPACSAVFDRLPREDAPKECTICGHKADEPFPETGQDEHVRLDLLPARPDLFDSAGLARALVGYLGIRTGLPEYAVSEGEVVVTVDDSVKSVRPEIACAELVVPAVDLDTLVEIMQLQENLHWAVGRDRKKASIGVYDLSTHGTKIRWTTEAPDYEFVPLGMPGEEMSLADILAGHPKGTKYAHLLDPFDRYPILVDEAGQVLSMPPIINSEETKLTEGATRLLVYVTGPDRRAVEDCLALVVSSVAELGGEVKTVRIVDGDEERVTPDLTAVPTALSPERAAKLIGVEMDRDAVVANLDRMRLGVEDDGGDIVTVLVPRYRMDVKHEVDLIEDVAIAHGYHRLPADLVPTMTVAQERPLTRLCRGVRDTLTGLGSFEVLSFFLTNRDEHLTRMRLPEEMSQVTILNPISVYQEIARVHLLSGLMGAFALNKTKEMPQPIFEIGDVAWAGEDSAGQRRLVAIGEMGPRSDYATIRATVDALLHELDVEVTYAPADGHAFAPVFLDGRAATVSAGGREVGFLGEVHPEVITGWGLEHPVVLAEIDLDLVMGGAEE